MITVAIWSHALAAILFGALALWQFRRPEGGMQRRILLIAFGVTALWALVITIEGPLGPLPRIGESLRNLGWLGFMLSLLRRGDRRREGNAITALYIVLGLILCAQTAIDLMPIGMPLDPTATDAFFFASLLLRMTVAIGALLLVHNLYTAAAPESRWGIRLPMIALAAMWAYDLNLYTVAYLGHGIPGDLMAMRGPLMVMLVPLFALASRRNERWKMRLSRAANFQSLSLMAIGIYLVAMVIVAKAIEMIGGQYVSLAQVAVVFGMSIWALVFLPSDKARAWFKVKVLKHLFQHRYDYRVEWMRFTDTLGKPGGDAMPLDMRVVQAVADITESPGGALLIPDESGGLTPSVRWNWPSADLPQHAGDMALVAHFERTGRIIEFDALRSEGGDIDNEAALMPEWIMAERSAWAAVPLVHFSRLVGVVLLERPRVDRTLDWEDFDLLRVAGRQVASYLAEARGQEALNDARRFDEFNRRFAFIMHDIKNLVSQLSLVARNAEKHAGNPDFQADMVATLKSSVGKMNDLLARLSQHNKGKSEEPRATSLKSIAEAVAAAKRVQHPVHVDGRDVIALADAPRLEQTLAHLVQNAIDASPPGEPIWMRVERRGLEAVIEVLDHGSGMSPEFLRNRLFKPFASTKEGGFGIGAYEARSLIAAMGGRLEVESREGEGTRFSVVLPVTESTAATTVSGQRSV
jgi:putative PEP-CTERM system histidine kinase